MIIRELLSNHPPNESNITVPVNELRAILAQNELLTGTGQQTPIEVRMAFDRMKQHTLENLSINGYQLIVKGALNTTLWWQFFDDHGIKGNFVTTTAKDEELWSARN